MKAMILAAGRGERMRPLTDKCPKPLLPVHDKPLIVYHLEKLARIGIQDVVINLAHLPDKVVRYLGNGERYNLRIAYSIEAQALETAGGVKQALPLLGTEPFLLINGDVWSEYPFESLLEIKPAQAHLVLVDNPEHHLQGDFDFANGQLGLRDTSTVACARTLTYSGIGVYHPDFFGELSDGKQALGPMLRDKIQQELLTAEYYSGKWVDVGTVERLSALENYLAD